MDGYGGDGADALGDAGRQPAAGDRQLCGRGDAVVPVVAAGADLPAAPDIAARRRPPASQASTCTSSGAQRQLTVSPIASVPARGCETFSTVPSGISTSQRAVAPR